MAQIKFALCSENDVFGIATIDDEATNSLGYNISEGYNSNPLIIEIPENLNVEIGWVYDGQNFREQ